MSEPSEKKLRTIVKERTPLGWTVIERGPWPVKFDGKMVGYCDYSRKTIVCRPIKCRVSLAIFLHEVAHAEYAHDLYDAHYPAWVWEYEAETWAMKAMRAEGLSVPKLYIKEAKRYVRSLLEDWFGRMNTLKNGGYQETYTIEPSDKVLRFAYGAEWRKYR